MAEAPVPMELKEFLKLVQIQHDMIKEFIEVSKKKKDFIVKNDMDGIKNILPVEKALSKKYGEIEKKQKKTANLLAAAIGVRSRQFKYDVLLEKYKNHSVYDSILKSKNDITKVLEELNKINSLNKELIDKSLAHIDYSINTFKSSTGSMYIAGDGTEISTGRSLFDASQ